MALSNNTFNDVSGAVSDLLNSKATAASLRLKAQGDVVEGTNYDLAGTLAEQNSQFTKQSTDVKLAQSQRETEMGVGQEQADIAGNGFTNSGSSLDLLRSATQQGALSSQLLAAQGQITEAGYDEQAKSYENLSTYAKQSSDALNQQADNAEENGWINAGVKTAAAIGSLFV